MAKNSMACQRIFYHDMEYSTMPLNNFHVENEYTKNIPWHDMKYFWRCSFLLTWSELAHACLHTHLLTNVVAHSSYHYRFANLDDHVVLFIVMVFWLLYLVVATMTVLILMILYLGVCEKVMWKTYLKAKFKYGKTNISKLAYKCMRHENMKPIGLKNLIFIHYKLLI